MSAETSVPVSQETEEGDRLVYDGSNKSKWNFSDDTLIDSEEFASATMQHQSDKAQKKSAGETRAMPALSLIGSEVFNEPMPTGSMIGDSNASTDEADQTAESSMFDNDSNVMIRKKKTKLDFDYMRKVQKGFLGDETPSERPVRD